VRSPLGFGLSDFPMTYRVRVWGVVAAFRFGTLKLPSSLDQLSNLDEE